MDELQKSLISIGAIIILCILIYLGSIFYLKSRKKMNDNKMLTMNLVIKHKLFLEYVKYQEKRNQNYLLYLIKINNLGLLEQTYSDHIVRNYLTMIAKTLSIDLPFGGKIAQTNQRDTFIMFYPNIDSDAHLLGKQIQRFAQKIYHENGVHIIKTNSIASIDHFDLKGLSSAMISSVRSLGEPIAYDPQKHHLNEDFITLSEKIKKQVITMHSYHVATIKVQKANEVYNEVAIQNIRFVDFMNQLPLIDQAWVNMHIIEYVLNKLYHKNVYANISIPALMTTMEKFEFVAYLETIVKANQFLLEHIVITMYMSNVSDDDQFIKNILTLSNMGMKIAFNIDDIHQNVYNMIQRYHVKRLIINDVIMQHPLCTDLLYFAKVNHIEVLYKSNQDNLDEQHLNVTHITKNTINLDVDKQKRGKR